MGVCVWVWVGVGVGVGVCVCLHFVLLLCCMQIGFAAPEAATGLKLLEAGVPKEKLALIAVPLMPLQIITPLVLRFGLIQKHTNGCILITVVFASLTI